MKAIRGVLSPIGLLFLVAGLAGCRTQDLGIGLNTVHREFTRPQEEVWEASVNSVTSMGLTLETQAHDSLGGEIQARRADESPVSIRVKSIGPARTRVSVRVGKGDVELAGQVQESIAEGLGLGVARAGFFKGGNALEGVYDADLTTCVRSARRGVIWSRLTITDEETHPTWAMIDARQEDSTPVRIRMESRGEAVTHVTFTVGNAETPDHAASAAGLKGEFEKVVVLAGMKR
ncbi:MAG: DUF3568 family protein [Planctomycetes bacterium]|nr:DUF3568 family protein [Planctomycetota bacterium]